MTEQLLKSRLKKLTVFLIITNILILSLGSYAAFLFHRSMRVEIQSKIDMELREYYKDVLRKVQSDVQSLETLAGFLEFGGETDSQKFAQGLRASNDQTSFIGMSYYNADGSGTNITIDGTILPDISLSDSLPMVQQTVQTALQGSIGICDAHIDDGSGEMVLSYAVPVWDHNEVMGALMASQSLDTFSYILDGGVVLSEVGMVVCINGEGEILAASQRAKNLDCSSIYDWELGTEHPGFSKLLQNGGNGVQYFDYYDVPAYIAMRPVNHFEDLYLMVVDTEDSVVGHTYDHMLLSQTIGFALMLVSMGCLIWGLYQVREQYAQTMRLAYYDELTKAYNLAKFKECMYGLKQPYEGCVVAMNVRQFKFINEIFGEEQADRLLVYITDVYKGHLKEGEYFCREASDTFFLYLHQCDYGAVSSRLERMMKQIGEIRMDTGQRYPIVLYCGVAALSTVDGERVNFQETETRVMFALRQAKIQQNKGGIKNNVCFYDEDVHKQEQLENYIESHMKQALVDREFQLYLQPKTDLRTGRLSGAEALVRWQTEDGQMLYPDQFIPLFEANGFCGRLDLYMVTQVCKTLRRWMDEGKKPISISVNQSRLLFYEDDYIEKLMTITTHYGVSPTWITLEILEGLVVGDVEQLNERVNQLKKLGFRISMDDFGSGYSSLNTLGKIDIDELKIDRMFLIAASEHNGHRQRLILQQIAELARKMRIDTVVEGIETFHDECLMKQFGCDYGQGYYYSRPIPLEEFETRFMQEKQEHSHPTGHYE